MLRTEALNARERDERFENIRRRSTTGLLFSISVQSGARGLSREADGKQQGKGTARVTRSGLRFQRATPSLKSSDSTTLVTTSGLPLPLAKHFSLM